MRLYSTRIAAPPFSGFTLAELLIALVILGVIATFTIPKVLQSQQDSRFNSIAKETAGTLSGAYSAYQLQNSANAGTGGGDLTPYLNYVSVFTRTIDLEYTNTTRACTGAYTCFQLHNGAVLMYNNTSSFGATATTSAIMFIIDPDGKVTDGTTNGPGKSLQFLLYYTGMLKTRGTTLPNTLSTTASYPTPVPSEDPPWFSW